MATSKQERARARIKAARREEYFARARQRRQKRIALILVALLGLSGLGTIAVLLINSGDAGDGGQSTNADANGAEGNYSGDADPGTDNDGAGDDAAAGDADGATDPDSSDPIAAAAQDPDYPCEIPTDIVSEAAFQRATAPDPADAEDRDWAGTLSTNCGDIEFTLDGAAAPQAVSSFLALAQDGFYDNTACHRLTTSGIFVLQCGDPTQTGTGGPGYSYGPIENAPADDQYPAGTLAMARMGGDGDSMGSQFFITYADSTIPSDNAGGYTVLGQVTAGLDAVVRIAEGGLAANGVAPQWPIAIEKVALK